MENQRVLLVDDEPDILELLDITLSRMGLDIHRAANLQQAMSAISQFQPDLCLTDMRLPDGNGISLVEHMQRVCPQVPVAMITAHGSVETAIQALKAGAFDFISKPIELENLRNLVTTALQLGNTESAPVHAPGNQLTGTAPAIEQLKSQIAKLARSQAPVHIHGESGVGKEVVARLIHHQGPRCGGPFIAVNCGAIPAELVESELFGHIKGSFTGANQDKPGLFQAASGGSLLLDEVADLPPGVQVKLLRAIQERAVRPVGGAREEATDVRILSATHKDLAAEVEAGRFRSDLFYRINVIGLHVPPLRQRRDDLPALVRSILDTIAQQLGSTAPELDESAQEALHNYAFPGNVRELENVLERAVALSNGNTLSAADFQFSTGPTVTGVKKDRAREHGWSPQDAYGDMEAYLEDIERQIISSALEDSRWNKTAAAKLLGLSFRSLRYRLKKLGLDD